MGALRILIVEDDFLCRFTLTRMMAEFGFVEVAVNGKEALDLFTESHKSKQPYDLILLDIMMPVMSGNDALREIRKYEQSIGLQEAAGCKVILTTAVRDPKTVVGSFNGENEAFVAKPYSRKDIVGQMKKIGFSVS